MSKLTDMSNVHRNERTQNVKNNASAYKIACRLQDDLTLTAPKVFVNQFIY